MVEFEKLNQILLKMHNTDGFTITKAFAIENENLKKSFDLKLIQTEKRLEQDPNLFAQKNWKSNRGDWREVIFF